MTERANLHREFAKLVGKPAWGLCRTHGSMFFLEMGDAVSRSNRKKDHGEWHFLVEMLHWRFMKEGQILVGSSDEKERIDTVFAGLSPGLLTAINLVAANDLNISFGSGVSLLTFTDAAAGDWNKWTLYCPGNLCWSADLGGIRHGSIYSER